MAESNFTDRNMPRAQVPIPLRIAATLLRTTFILLLGILTLRASLPERESVYLASVRLDDLVRMALGLAVCVWLVVHVFKGGPQSKRGYQTWLYLGLVVVPFTLTCLFAIW
ncbi:MAG TPA: hypothetical protein VMU69_08100 [Bradyrhizobium sp.]|nr:hypothetical protein [Bradyrhizobium sp.]